MKSFLKVAVVFSVVVLGIKGFGFADEKHKHQQGMMGTMMEKCEMMDKSCTMDKCCPMMVENSEVSVEKIPDGVVIKVTAKDKKAVAEIQKRAEAIKECKPKMKSEIKKDADETVVCPVTGDKMKKSKAYDKVEYKGKTYYFCCDMCKPMFLKDPEKYIK